jgi:hypothetical protein
VNDDRLVVKLTEAKMPTPNRLLWVDDQIDRYGPWIAKFGEHGTQVDASYTLEEGLRKLEENYYDVVMIDLMIGHESCMHVLPVFAQKARGANLFVCSSFFYLPDVMKEFSRERTDNQIRIGRLDKTNLPFTDDAAATIQFLSDLGKTDNPTEMPQGAVESSGHGPIGSRSRNESTRFPSWDHYVELDASGKIEALKAAAERTQEIRAKAHEAGYRYLVFCGSWTEPLIKLTTVDAIPTQDVVVEKARTLGYAPFVFSVGGSIDDFSEDCSNKSGLSGYPILKLTFRGSSEEVHFDTGNPYTLLSYEWYTEKGWLPVNRIFDMHTAGEMELIGNHFRLPDALVTDSSGVNESVSLEGFAVTGWASKRLATICSRDCATSRSADLAHKFCKFRTGLLGRNLARKFASGLKINFKNGQCFFAEIE